MYIVKCKGVSLTLRRVQIPVQMEPNGSICTGTLYNNAWFRYILFSDKTYS